MADDVEMQFDPGTSKGGDRPQRLDPEEAALMTPATKHWRTHVLIAAAIALLGSGLMVVASFMPWLNSEDGRIFSGWDLYEHQRAAGKNIYMISGFFTDPQGHLLTFPTGLATLLSGLALAGWTIIFLTLTSLLRRRVSHQGKPLTYGYRPPASLVTVVNVLVLALVCAASVMSATSYFKAGEAFGASLGLGLPLLWVATYVAFVGNMAGFFTAWGPEKLRIRNYLGYSAVGLLGLGAAAAGLWFG